jgi:flagellar protein FliO/FliZ
MISLLRLSLVGFLLSSQLAFAANEATAMPEVTTQVTAPGEEASAIGARSIASEATEAKAVLTEKEIPLNVDVNKKATDSTSNSTRLFLTVFIMLSVMGTTYYMVRKYKLSNNINKSNTKIKILSQHYLGPKKSLAIIHVAGESMLIGVTDSNISMIKSLSLIDDEVPADLPQNFSDTLQIKEDGVTNTRAMVKTAPAGASAKATSVEDLEEEFSFSGIKDSVSKKLKSMRSLS